MTREEAKEYFEECNEGIITTSKDENVYDYEKQEIMVVSMRETYEANIWAISALSENKGDLISRQAVDDVIYDYSRSHAVDYAQIMERIDKLPSVENKGEWIYDGDCIHCSSCKSAFNNLIGFNFCPNCGADMREGE